MEYLALIPVVLVCLYFLGESPEQKARRHFFWLRLTRNADKYYRWPSRLRVVRINAKHMLKQWFETSDFGDAYLSFRAYQKLRKAGFKITRYHDKTIQSEIYRFWWNDKLIDDIPDIDHVYGDDFSHWNTVKNGTTRRLGMRTDIYGFRHRN